MKNMTTKPFDPRFEESISAQYATKQISTSGRTSEESDRKGLASALQLVDTNFSITKDDNDRISIQDATLAILIACSQVLTMVYLDLFLKKCHIV